MDWVLQHLQLIIGAAGAVAWWLNQRRQAHAGKDTKAPKERPFEDSELAERTRRIREEIQRKIEQRTKTYTQAPQVKSLPPSPPPVIREVIRRQPEPPPLAMTKAATIRKTAEILEQQATLAEQLRRATELKSAALRRIQFENQISSGDQAAVVARGALADDLRDSDALRRAFILREVIGPPVGLR